MAATKTQKAQTTFITNLLDNTCLEQDRWGHLKGIALNGRTYRIKIQKTSWRFEVKSGSGWFRVSGSFYTKTVAGQLQHFYDNFPKA